MRGANVHVFVHFVWATWDRLPLITPEVRGIVYRTILGKCDEMQAHPPGLGGVEDHVHLLVRLPATVPLANQFGEIKGASAFAVTKGKSSELFKWQGGYGAFSVSEHRLGIVQKYIREQATHHHTLGVCP
jgi:putative transposase